MCLQMLLSEREIFPTADKIGLGGQLQQLRSQAREKALGMRLQLQMKGGVPEEENNECKKIGYPALPILIKFLN